MENNIGSLINQFELVMEKIKKQNQSNLDMIGDFIDIYDLAIQGIKNLNIYQEIVTGRREDAIIALLDVLMIIGQNPMNEVVHEIQDFYSNVDGVLQVIKIDVIKPTTFGITKQVLQHDSFLNSMIYFDPRKINEEVIELFDAYYLIMKETYLKIDQSNISSNVNKLCSWILKIVDFSREYCKRNIKVLNYPKFRNIIYKIDELLQTHQQQVCQEQIKEQSEMEQTIQMVFECFKKQKSITHIQTDCLLILRNKFEIKDWIYNQRPLYYWTTLDDEPAGIMFQWIAELKKNSSLIEILKTANIGFDFLLLLNQSELDQISMLNLNPDLDQFSQFILDNLKNVKLKNIQQLELANTFMRTASDNKENERTLFQFLNQQQNITSLLLQQCNNKNIIITEILQSFPCIQNLQCLSIKIISVNPSYIETLINEINKCSNLSKFSLKFSSPMLIFAVFTFIELSQGLNNIKKLKVFKITIESNLTGITTNIIHFIEQQQNLLEFKYINDTLFQEEIDYQEYKDLLKVLETKKIRCLNFGFRNDRIQQSFKRNLYKLKDAVKLKYRF